MTRQRLKKIRDEISRAFAIGQINGFQRYQLLDQCDAVERRIREHS